MKIVWIYVWIYHIPIVWIYHIPIVWICRIPIVWIYHILLVCSLVDEHLSYFRFWLIWAILVWRFVYKLLCGHIFISIGFIPRNGIAESNVNSVLNFLKHCRTVFQSGCTILYFHKQRVRVLIDLSTSLLMLLLIWLFIIAISFGMKWFITMVLICNP